MIAYVRCIQRKIIFESQYKIKRKIMLQTSEAIFILYKSDFTYAILNNYICENHMDQ
jgi:hypothetical protein